MKSGLKCWLALSAVVSMFAVLILVRAAKTEARISNAVETSSDAQTIYAGKCASCHGKDGRAKSMRGKLSHARDLTDGSWQNDVTDERLFNSISNGRKKMPSFKKKLSEEQINALVSYVRRLKN